MTYATLNTDQKFDNLVVFFKVGSEKCRAAPQYTLHIAKVVSQRWFLTHYTLQSQSLAQFTMQGGLTMRGWSSKVSRCTMYRVSFLSGAP